MLKIIIPFFVFLFSFATPALADVESWNFFETRIPLIEKNENFPKTNLRVFSGALLNNRSQGVGSLLIRVGPLVDITPWLFTGFHGVLMADRTSAGDFIQESRGEIEPNFYGRLGDFTLLDRNRLEFRNRTTGNQLWYRNMARINYAPQGMPLSYFISNEVFIDLLKGNLVQNRAIIGLGININKGLKLDTGYMLRSRYLPVSFSWEIDHILIMVLTADLIR